MSDVLLTLRWQSPKAPSSCRCFRDPLQSQDCSSPSPPHVDYAPASNYSDRSTPCIIAKVSTALLHHPARVFHCRTHTPADSQSLSSIARCSNPEWLGGSSSRLAVSDLGAPVNKDRAKEPDACTAQHSTAQHSTARRGMKQIQPE
jgi:hypothetical protein